MIRKVRNGKKEKKETFVLPVPIHKIKIMKCTNIKKTQIEKAKSKVLIAKSVYFSLNEDDNYDDEDDHHKAV